MLMDAQQVARWLGRSPSWVYALKRFAKNVGDNPFTIGGRFTTKLILQRWLEDHLDFVASHQYRRARKQPAKDPAQPVGYISDEPPPEEKAPLVSRMSAELAMPETVEGGNNSCPEQKIENVE